MTPSTPHVCAALLRKQEQVRQFTHDVESWLTTHPMPELGALIAATGLSLRQVERNCQLFYGRSPKAMAREARARRAAAAMTANPKDGYDVIEFGFYDQSHMIREIKCFTGKTPSQIRFPKAVAARPGAHRLRP